jgi:hypothetical protein
LVYRADMTGDVQRPARTLDDAERQRALNIIRKLRDPTVPDEAGGALVDELTRLLRHPGLTELVFWRTPELTDEEVIAEALRYHPIVGYPRQL